MVEEDKTSKDDVQADESLNPSALVRAVRVAVAGVARMVAPPFGENAKLAAALRRVDAALSKLSGLSEEEFITGLEHLANLDSTSRTPERPRNARGSLRGMNLDAVERIVNDSSTTKNALLAVARERFDAPTGALMKMNRAAVAERLSALVMNERGHATVARLASAEPHEPTMAVPVNYKKKLLDWRTAHPGDGDKFFGESMLQTRLNVSLDDARRLIVDWLKEGWIVRAETQGHVTYCLKTDA